MCATLTTNAHTDAAAMSTPRKRNHKGELIDIKLETIRSNDDTTSTNVTSRQASPTPSNASSELTELTSTGLASPAPGFASVDGASDALALATAANKKRKLTFAEKEVERAVRQREKDEKARQKAEDKVRKEEEKRQKDEEKRKKEEEKEVSKRAKELERAEKKKARDAERLEKEAEKAKKEAEKNNKEQEKLKKEKSQLRIASFFGRPAPQSTPPATPDDASSGASSRRSSIAAIDIAEPVLRPHTTGPTNPDFEKYIIPYFIHEHTDVAPINRFNAARRVDVFGGKQSNYELELEKSDIEPLQTRFGRPKKRMRMMEPVKEIAERVQATQIDTEVLAGDYNPLAFVPYKILSFREDIRPPYVGTYTKRILPMAARKMSRKPAFRGRLDTNYDYDSEAEWEEPAADDEEILDDEMSESEDGDEDMNDFLDDEEDQGRKRMFAGEMEPLSSGICFQGEDYNSSVHNMEDYRMDVLHDSTQFPIDPFSTAHWSDVSKEISAKTKLELNGHRDGSTKADATVKSMPPPSRVPLSAVSPPNTLNTYLAPGNTIVVAQNENIQNVGKLRGRAPNSNKELKMISSEFMDAFKHAIDGSDLTKAGLIEILKKQFPKCSKDAIKDTLGMVAVRVGKKESEKKWELLQ